MLINNLEELKNYPNPPSLLVVLCQGAANIINPFDSKLLLNKVGIKLSKLLSEKINLKNSRVYLGACETDFVPPLSSPLDEHLSLSIPFLLNDASEVISTMYEISPNDRDEIISNNADFESVKNYQLSKLKDYKRGDPNSFYKAIAFRMLKTN